MWLWFSSSSIPPLKIHLSNPSSTLWLSVAKRSDPCDLNKYRPISLTLAILKLWSPTTCVRFSNPKDCRTTDSMDSDLVGQTATCYNSFHFWPAIPKAAEKFTWFHSISTAFDRVWHERLLAKLLTFGFFPALVSWTLSVLNKRTISAQVDEAVLSQSYFVSAFSKVQHTRSHSTFYLLMTFCRPPQI